MTAAPLSVSGAAGSAGYPVDRFECAAQSLGKNQEVPLVASLDKGLRTPDDQSDDEWATDGMIFVSAR